MDYSMSALSDEQGASPRFSLDHDSTTGASWCFLDQTGGRPNCNPEMMDAARDLLQGMCQRDDVRYLVMGSRFPGVFNLGGDLDRFVQWAEAEDRGSLMEYGLTCIDIIELLWSSCGGRHLNIALVQGDAMGGGFETAMCYDVIVAERQARFSLPEIKFGLFPGMGAHSLLSRKVGAVMAKRMLSSGLVYTAEEMHDMGLVDILADEGMGESAVHSYIDSTSARHGGHLAIAKAGRMVNPLSREELVAIVTVWVDRVLELSPLDLKKMARIVKAQNRLSS